ncbi:tubulinyl-Tyr carboxypeptidase 2-like [Convolutriloba macropyga]|uniref:tubulinyl-Tyr carboxypeptidase 2-like n=1 Tax=Convolutriloba macropyga TaxID=536237 RepID=UPI003F525269
MTPRPDNLHSASSTPALPTSSREAAEHDIHNHLSSSFRSPNSSSRRDSSVVGRLSSLSKSFSSRVDLGRGEANNPDDDDFDDEEAEGVLFYVNKTGFPIADNIYQRMWDFACRKHPEGTELQKRCQSDAQCIEVPIPKEPKVQAMKCSLKAKLKTVQSYMESLEYNHTGTQFFDIIKNRPLISQMEVCRKMIQESLPIKCLEASILGIYLTNGIPGLERFPLSFKSTFSGKSARHVVLGVYHNGLYGSLGMSRRSTLAYKPLNFDSLSALVTSFEKCYAEIGHKISRLAIGIPVTHDCRSFETIVWRNFAVNSYWKKPKDEIGIEIDKYAKEMRTKMRTSVPVTSFLAPPNMNDAKPYAMPYSSQGNPNSLKRTKSDSNSVLKKSQSSDNLKSVPHES